MKTYRGTRGKDGFGCRIIVDEEGQTRDLDPRNDLWNHSPDGFEWGYGGSGPAQSSLAILADALGDDERAVDLHQRFKRAVIASLERKSWSMTIHDVLRAVGDIERENE